MVAQSQIGNKLRVMELLYLSLSFIFIFLLFKLKNPKSHNNHPLPPGPWKIPIIGNIHNMIGSAPHRSLRALSLIHGPIMLLKLGQITTVVISSPEAAHEIMKTHDLNFSSRPMINASKITTYGGKSLVFAPYGEYWRQLRKICVVELLSARRVVSFESIRAEEVLSVVRSIFSCPLPSINLTQRINALTNDITLRAVVGYKCEDQEGYLSAMDEAVEAGSGFDLEDLFPSSRIVRLLSSGKRRKMSRVHKNLDRILSGVLQEHKERRASGMPADDLLDALLRLQEAGGAQVDLTDECLKSVILDIFGAGSETSATTTIWAMAELVRNPRVMKKAQSEIRGALGQNQEGRPLTEYETNELSYLKLVIKETLRLHVPLSLLLPRECRSTCEVMGYKVPAKARVLVNAWAIARDARYWGDDAEDFRPERFERSDVDYKGAHFEFLPFGGGRRICPGILFGVANVEHALAQLLCYFDWEVPEGGLINDLDMSEKFGATLRKRTDLYLRATPRIPCPVI